MKRNIEMRHMLSRKPPKCLRKLYFVFLKWPLEIFRDAKAFNELQLNFIFFFFGGLFESLAVTNLGAVDAKGIYAHESPSNPS